MAKRKTPSRTNNLDDPFTIKEVMPNLITVRVGNLWLHFSYAQLIGYDEKCNGTYYRYLTNQKFSPTTSAHINRLASSHGPDWEIIDDRDIEGMTIEIKASLSLNDRS